MAQTKKLVVDNLTISFRTNQGMVRAVRGVSFELEEGETLAIVGESGSGKSVTSKAIMGILAGNAVIDKGSIMYENQDLTKIEEEDFHRIRGDKIGMIFQDPMSSLNPIMRIGKQITEGMLINGNHLKKRYKRLIHVEKHEVKNLRKKKWTLREDMHIELKDAKDKDATADELAKIKEKFTRDLANTKTKLKEAKAAYKKAKKDARATVRQEWKTEKTRIGDEIAKLQAKKKAAAKQESPEERKEYQEKARADLNKEKQRIDEQIRELKTRMKSADSKTKAILYQQIHDLKDEFHVFKKKQREESYGSEKRQLQHEISEKREELRRVKRVTKRQAYERAIEVMNEVGIPQPEKRIRQYPFQFSGGMRQRIVIAVALTANPDLLICDEPTTALDVTIQSQILELIKKLKTERSLSVIFITHDLGVVANMADRIAVMYAGKIVEIGTYSDIFYKPKHPYTWALLSSVPDLESKERLVAIPGTPPNMLFPPKGDAFAERSEYAMKIDFEKQPPLFKISDEHYAATWLLHKDAPKVEMPELLKRRIKHMTEDEDRGVIG